MYVVVFSLLTANDVLAVAEVFVLLTTGLSAFSSVTRSAVLTVEDVRYATPNPPPRTDATTPHANAAALRLPINSSFPEKTFSIFFGLMI